MPTTPPPRSVRAHTPPTPLHGARYDTYEPYSPRRSTRSTAHSNPYSSFNSDKLEHQHHHQQRNITPPPTVKKARFARAPTQLSSPPSSPASPVKRLRTTPAQSAIHKTPRKQSSTPRKAATTHSDSDTCVPSSSKATTSAPPNTHDPTTMLPTPSKTPNKKRPAAALASTARVLSLQPNHPNDVMPTPHKLKKQSRATEFDLYDEEAQRGDEIAIYTDANARVPEMDESMDNPFVGPKQTQRGGGSRRARKSVEEREREERMQEAVNRDEGVVYVFRGRKVFRRFTPPGAVDDNSDDPTSTPNRRLVHQAGVTAQRPLTRSAIKPRLLFPSEDQRRKREQALNEVDEEALTDIEMADTTTAMTPPSAASTKRRAATPKKRSPRAVEVEMSVETSPIVEEAEADAPDPMSVGSDPSFTNGVGGKGKASATAKSPFDTWARTKSGRKRSSEKDEVEEGMGKRTRSSGPVAQG